MCKQFYCTITLYTVSLSGKVDDEPALHECWSSGIRLSLGHTDPPRFHQFTTRGLNVLGRLLLGKPWLLEELRMRVTRGLDVRLGVVPRCTRRR